MEEVLPKMKKFVLKNSETRFQKAETRFQKAETRFQNAQTPLSRIFLARAWMDCAQKKPVPYPFLTTLKGYLTKSFASVGFNVFYQKLVYLKLNTAGEPRTPSTPGTWYVLLSM